MVAIGRDLNGYCDPLCVDPKDIYAIEQVTL